MRKGNSKIFLILLSFAVVFVVCFALGCGEKKNTERKLPQLSVTSDVADAPYAVSMGDYVLKQVKFGGETLSSDLYKSKNGHLIFLVDSYAEFGAGTLSFTLVFETGEEMTLQIAQTDEKDPQYVLPEVAENYIFTQKFDFPVAEKLKEFQNFSFRYVAKMGDEEVPLEVTESAVRVSAPKEGDLDFTIEVIRNEEVFAFQTYRVKTVSEENYNAIFDAALSEQFVSRWQKQSLINEVEFFGAVTDNYGVTKSAIKFINNEYLGRGDERTFGLPVEYVENAISNGYNTLNFSYFVPDDADNRFENDSVYVARWDSDRQVMNWDKVYYGTSGVGKWFDVAVPLDRAELEGYSVSLMCESKSWYVSDVHFSYVAPVDDPLYNAIGKMSEANAVEMVGETADNNGVRYAGYHFINNTAAQEGDNRAFYISREYLGLSNDTISFKYYIPEGSEYNGQCTLYFAPSDGTAYQWDKLHDAGSVVGAWTQVEFPLTGEYDFAILAAGYEFYIADVQATRTQQGIKVNYLLNGGESDDELSVVFDPEGAVPELITAERAGYDFYGWFNKGVKVNSLSELTESADLTARWAKKVPLADLGYKDVDGGRAGEYHNDEGLEYFRFDSWNWCRIAFEKVSLEGCFMVEVKTSTDVMQQIQLGASVDGGASLGGGASAVITTQPQTEHTVNFLVNGGGTLCYFVHGGDTAVGSGNCHVLELTLIY